MKIGLQGYGYWGKVVHSKLKNCIINPVSFDFDWMFVTTPPEQHYEYVKKYLDNNINVFCEKPLTSRIETAKELIDLAQHKNINLYIDNIFLFRNEIKNNKYIPRKSIKFEWYKYGPFKDTLINDLLYHDLYLLIYFIGSGNISNITIKNKTKNKLNMCFLYNDYSIEIDYDREYTNEKHKIIKLDDIIINLSVASNDALKETIDACFNNKIDYIKNHSISLDTLTHLKNFYD